MMAQVVLNRIHGVLIESRAFDLRGRRGDTLRVSQCTKIKATRKKRDEFRCRRWTSFQKRSCHALETMHGRLEFAAPGFSVTLQVEITRFPGNPSRHSYESHYALTQSQGGQRMFIARLHLHQLEQYPEVKHQTRCGLDLCCLVACH